MGDIKIPTCGRQVHFFPNNKDAIAAANGAEVLPAFVIQAFSTKLNLQVLTMNPDAKNVLRYSVAHKSELTDTYQPAYWDWPEMK